MVKVDPDLQRIAGKPAYLAFLSDIKGWGIFICVWTQSVPIWVSISSAGTSQKISEAIIWLWVCRMRRLLSKIMTFGSIF